MPRMARNDSSNRPVPPGSSVSTLCALYTALYKWPTKAHSRAMLRYIQVACGALTTTQRVVKGRTGTSQCAGSRPIQGTVMLSNGS